MAEDNRYMQMEIPIIQLKGLTKRYGSHLAVDNLNLQVNKGEIFGLLGPNGAGKTTSILMMLGLTEPTKGSALVCGYNATTDPIKVKTKVGYMPDSVGFYDHMTALDNLLYIGRLNGLAEHQLKHKVELVLELVGLNEAGLKKTATFSRGMKQRLGLAEVLIKDPEVIILDEPTLGIDPTGVKDFLVLIRKLSREQGLTVLLSSHHLHHVQQVCDRVGIFVEGRLLAEGDLPRLAEQLFGKNGYVTSIALDEHLSHPWPPERVLQGWDAIDDISYQGETIVFSCNRNITPSLVRFLVENDHNIISVNQKNYGLDDIYQRYFETQTGKSDYKRTA
ncbi:ABC transporter ATP-binding protein [Mucilaginibacter sp. SMC90]|uniref:ABC transporter ATP-binding protein n=1 Tax=Mucilaginibacter sp. SMC90 TaxID=2929803 RepID=UPI001FB3B7BB|nr:ABC transporter ATP-binding protein [Mucilaginibacter sp. SMC90]UOE49397.1 ABC transporter ATP-binding protein [Mucilaginibacter sp. SMC90]